jgi:hypothetical protein
MFSAINAHVVAQLTAATSSASDVAQLAAIYRRCQARSRRHTLRARDVATSGVAAPHARCHAHQCREVTATDRSRACECLAYSLSGASAHHRCRRRLSLSRRANPHRRAAVCRFRRRSSTVSGSASRASVRACELPGTFAVGCGARASGSASRVSVRASCAVIRGRPRGKSLRPIDHARRAARVAWAICCRPRGPSAHRLAARV